MVVPRFVVMLLYRPVRLLPVVIAAAFAITYLTMQVNHHNPNSHFFAPDETSFTATYSDMRKTQARNYIADIDARVSSSSSSSSSSAGTDVITRYEAAASSSSSAADRPDLAVVFLTTARPEEEYLDAALGSFLMELTPAQRKRMHITVSIGDGDARYSTVISDTWLHTLVDEIGVRNDVNLTHLAPEAAALPSERAAKLKTYPKPSFNTERMPVKTSRWHQGGSLDYSVGLQICSNKGAPHCLVVEDDVLFAADWFETFIKALEHADRNYGAGSKRQWGYIRLFYAEKYFGWENDEVPKLITWTVSAIVLVVLSLFFFVRLPAGHVALVQEHRTVYDSGNPYKARSSLVPPGDEAEDQGIAYADDHDADKLGRKGGRRRTPPGVILPVGTILMLGLLTLYSCIMVILSGRNYIYHVPKGISEMPTRGCCTQANVYPADILPELVQQVQFWHLERPYDINVNQYVDKQDRVKLALSPPLVQHIGLGSSRKLVDYTYERSTPLWSFLFEKSYMPSRPK